MGPFFIPFRFTMKRLQEHFERLMAEGPLRDALQHETQGVRLTPGQFVCMEGDACGHLALVLEGTARVYKTSDSGREITLYRVGPGESCILTTSCILSDRPFPAFAAAETEVAARLVPAPVVRNWMEAHPAWRTYVFDLLAGRLGAVIATLEEVAFRQLDARLAQRLLHTVQDTGDATIRTTHQRLAADLGSARAVVSRLLKDFEHDGWIRLQRGAITVLDAKGLRREMQRGGTGG